MSTFVYMTRCDGCGHCVDICPSDIMHIDENIRRAKTLSQTFAGNVIHVLKHVLIMQLMLEVMLILLQWDIALELEEKRKKEQFLGK
jgi:ferredoxin